MGQIQVANPSRPLARQSKDPFDYGWRLQRSDEPVGEEEIIQIPIQPDDFLDPQIGDYFMQGTCHDKDVDKLKGIFRRLNVNEPGTAIFSDLKMKWGILGLLEPAPDLAIVLNVRDIERPRQAFYVQQEGTQPRFVIEVVSPNYVDQDLTKKVKIYERAGIEEYIIIDSGLREWTDNLYYRIIGYRRQGERLVKIQPDDQGRIYSQLQQVWIAPSADRKGVEIVNARTGEVLLPDLEQINRERITRIQAEDRAEVAEEQSTEDRLVRAQAEEQSERDRLVRAQAEEQTERERLARVQAEEQTERERLARVQAEEQTERERLARVQAEEQTERERLARVQIEAKMAEAQAKLRALGIEF